MDDWFDKAFEDSEDGTDDAEDWHPATGEVLKGEMVKADYIKTRYGWMYVAYVADLENDKKPVKVWCGRTSLKNQMIDAAPKPGTLMAVRFAGKVSASKPGANDWFKYEVSAKESDFAYWQDVAQKAKAKREQVDEAAKEAKTQADFGPDEDPF